MTVEKANITPELINSLELKEQPYFITSINSCSGNSNSFKNLYIGILGHNQ